MRFKNKGLSIIFVSMVFVLFVVFVRSPSNNFQFQPMTQNKESAEFSERGRNYIIEKYDSEGSGQYVLYTVYRIDERKKLFEIAQFTTCGHMKKSGLKLFFYEPAGFHCGLFSIFKDIFYPTVSTLEFLESEDKVIRSQIAK